MGFYVANSCEDLIRGVAAAGKVRTEGKTEEQGLKQKWNEKRMHGKFVREMPEKVDKKKTWQWLSRGELKISTEAVLCAAQEQAIRTNYVK